MHKCEGHSGTREILLHLRIVQQKPLTRWDDMDLDQSEANKRTVVYIYLL